MGLWLAQNEDPSVEFLYQARCHACPLKQLHTEGKIKSWAIPARGSKNPDYYVLGLGPGQVEDDENRAFAGPTGKLLRTSLGTVSIQNVRYNNITRTRSLDNDPPKVAIEACRKWIEEDIVQTKPKVIIGLGGLVLHWVLGYDLNETIYNWRQRKIPVKFTAFGVTHFCWFVPTTHPASILRSAPSFSINQATYHRDSQEEQIEAFNKDLAFAKKLVNTSPDIKDFDIPSTDSFELINGNLKQAEEALEYFSSVYDAAIDLETTGVRPYGKNSKILCQGLSDGKRHVSICIEHPEAKWSTNDLAKLWERIKRFWNSNSRKIAQNMPFEFEWLAYKLGHIRRDHIEDTIAQIFCLDERRVQRLDLLCLLNFGLRLKSLSPLIHIDKLANDPWEIVGNYNIYDCIYEYKLFQKQKQQIIDNDLLAAYKEQIERIPTIAYTQIRGLNVDHVQVETLSNKYAHESQVRLLKIYANQDFIKGLNQIKGLVPTSPLKITRFFQNLGYNIKDSDDETLSEIDHPVAAWIRELREYQKLKNTYIDPLLPNSKDSVLWPDGLIHPQYSLTFVVTARTSCRDPNIQNFPKHGNIEPRSVIIPPPEHTLVSADYGQIEFRCLAVESQAPELLEYLHDTDKDIHYDWAKIILEIYPDAIKSVAKEDREKAKGDPIRAYRQVAKNGFVFAKCYRAGIEKIMQTLNVPEYVSRKLDKLFWERMAGVKKWHEQLDYDYATKGYIRNKLGRKRSWFKKGTELYNSAVQTLASDLVINSYNRLSIYAEETNQPQFQPVLLLHDDLSFYQPDESLVNDIEITKDIMLECPWDFFNVPRSVEFSTGLNWAKLIPYKTFLSK